MRVPLLLTSPYKKKAGDGLVKMEGPSLEHEKRTVVPKE
jgi:hypothetical protein